MDLDTNALVTLDYAIAMLNLDFDDVDETDKFIGLINAASAAANLYTNRLLAGRSHTKTFDGNGKISMLLPEYPVNSVASLYIDSDRAFGASTQITDFLFYEDGEVYYAGGFPDIRQSVKVTWNGGYASGSVPEDIKIAIVEIVKWYHGRLEGEAVGVMSMVNPDGVTTRFEMDIPYSAKRRLGPYRKVR